MVRVKDLIKGGDQQELSLNTILYWAIFITFIGCFAFIYANFPLIQDDWRYLGEITRWGEDKATGHHTWYDGIGIVFYNHYTRDTARIGNTIAFLLIYAPIWISKLIIIISFVYGFYLMAKLASVRSDQPAKLLLLCLTTVFFVNWQEYLFSIMYAFNYIVVLPLYFGCFLIFLRRKEINYLGLVVIGLLFGSWHESFSISFLLSAFVLFLMDKENRTKHNIALFISVGVGLLWVLAWPAAWNRASVYAFNPKELTRLMYLFPWLLSVVIGFGLRKTDYYKNNKSLVVSLLCTGLILIPFLIHTLHIRSLIPAYFLSAVVFTGSIYYLIQGKVWAKAAVAAVAALLSFGHLFAVCNETLIMKDVVNEVVRCGLDAKRNNEKEIFAPVRYNWNADWKALNRPVQDLFVPGWNDYYTFRKYIGYDNPEFRFVVPQELKEYTDDKGKLLEGNAGYKIYKGHIVSSDTVYRDSIWMNVGFPHFVDRNMTIHIKFTGADGKTYKYVSPMRSKKAMFMGDPISISY